jgi:hypothetical protein
MARTKITKTTKTSDRPLTRYTGVVPDTTILAAVPGWIGLGARVRLLPADLRASALALAADAVAKVEEIARERARADAGVLKVFLPLLVSASVLLGCAGPVSLPSAREPLPPTTTQIERLDELALPASIGDADANVVAAVAVVMNLRERDGSTSELLLERASGIPYALRDAAERIADYSDGRIRLRFELRVIDELIDAEQTSETGRWASPIALAEPIEREFPGGADLVVAFVEPYRINDKPVDAGYTGNRRFFGGDLPFVSMSSPYIAIWGGVIPPQADPTNPGDLFIHEFGHAVELWSEAAGIVAPQMHDAVEHGHLAAEGFRTDYSDWYREFFAAQPLFR